MSTIFLFSSFVLGIASLGNFLRPIELIWASYSLFRLIEVQDQDKEFPLVNFQKIGHFGLQYIKNFSQNVRIIMHFYECWMYFKFMQIFLNYLFWEKIKLIHYWLLYTYLCIFKKRSLHLKNLIQELKYYIDRGTGGEMPKTFKQLESAYQITRFGFLVPLAWEGWKTSGQKLNKIGIQ